MNVRSWNTGKFEDVCDEMKKNDLDFLAIVQTNMREEITKENDEFKIICKGRSKFQRQGGGLGIIIRKSCGINIEEINSISKDDVGEDIIAYNCEYTDTSKKNNSFILLICYMTVQGPNAEENKKKYIIVKEIVQKFREKKVIVMGDMNAHTGILGEPINRNGQKLLDFAEDCQLEILNHTIAEGKITWKAREFQSAIDYCLVNNLAREHVGYFYIDEEGNIDIDTDHNTLVLNFDISLGKSIEQPAKKSTGKWIVKGVCWDNFQVDMAELDILYENKNCDSLNEELIAKIKQSASKYVRKTGTRKRKIQKYNPWWNKEIDMAKKERILRNKECRRKMKNRGEIDDMEYQIGILEFIL